jgi:uncharacterized protein (TIGR03382 family)
MTKSIALACMTIASLMLTTQVAWAEEVAEGMCNAAGTGAGGWGAMAVLGAVFAGLTRRRRS